MRHLDPADRIILINECLSLLLEKLVDDPAEPGKTKAPSAPPARYRMSEPYTDYSGKYHAPERIYDDDIGAKESPLAMFDPFNSQDPWGAFGVGLASTGLKAMERAAARKLATKTGAETAASLSSAIERSSTATRPTETSLSKAASSDFSGMEPWQIKSELVKNQPKIPEHLKLPPNPEARNIDLSNPFDLDLLNYARDRVDFNRASKLADQDPKAAAHLYNKTKTSGTGVGLRGSRLAIDPLYGADVARLTYPDKSTAELIRAYDAQKQAFTEMGEKGKEFIQTYFGNPNDVQRYMFSPARLQFDNRFTRQWARNMDLDAGAIARGTDDVEGAYLGVQPDNAEATIILPANKSSRVTTDYEYVTPTSEYSDVRRSVSKNLNPIQRTINKIANAVRPLSSKNEIADSLSKTGTLDPETVRTLQHEYGHHLAGNSRAIRAEDELDVPYKLKKSEGAAEARANIISSRRTETTPLWDRVISNLTGKPLRHRTSSNLEPIAPDKIENILKNSDFADPTRDLDPETRKQVIDYFGNMVVRKNQNKQPGTETTRMA